MKKILILFAMIGSHTLPLTDKEVEFQINSGQKVKRHFVFGLIG